MQRTCDYCRGPISSSSFLGRPWPERAAATYCCYGCLSLGESDRRAQQPDSKSAFKLDGFAVRIGIGLLVAGQSMIFGLAINLEEQTPRAVKLGVQGVILAGTLLVLALLGPPLVRNAIAELRRGRLTIEALFLLTMAGAMFASLQSFITGQGPIYFEVVTVLLVVYALGKAIGARSRAAALASTQMWKSGLSTCRLIDNEGRVQKAEVTTVLPGDTVEVRPGEAIVVDGDIREGVGFVSEAPVSGEPFAVVRRPGDRVLAGAVSHDATFRIEATAPGTARQIDCLLKAVEEARSQPTSLHTQADRLGRIFFPLIVLMALATFVVWTQLSGWQTGLFNAMSVLLVACPCALGLATPIVVWTALNRLAERGLVVHAGDLIERLAQVDCVVFDKTGTLTEDQFALVDIATLAEGRERARLLSWLALIEEQCGHPIARPFATLPQPFPAQEIPRVVSLRVVPGCGVEAELDQRHKRLRLRVGRPEWINASGSDDESALLARLHASSGHRIDFEVDGSLVGIALVAERLRESVPETLAALKAMGLPAQVLTGDAPERAAALSLADAFGRLLPEDKRRKIVEMKQAGGRPLMVGDGINDVSALAVAHAGIALSSGADLANGAASATLYHGDLRVIPWAVALSRAAVRAVRRNLLRAAAYNAIGITLAAFGILHPVVAALLMVGSSLLVAWSSVRVGVSAELCGCSASDPRTSQPGKPRAPWIPATVHALAFAAQAIVALLLLALSPPAIAETFIIFALVGVATAYRWLRSPNLPHWLDMSFGMLTLGNLGMLLGWWADNGFARLRDARCCATVTTLHPWMWVGMLVFANLAMIFLARRPRLYCRAAMFTGGNLGMAAGMLLGGWLAGQVETDSVSSQALLSFVGMSLGMVSGMLLATALTRRLIGGALRLRQQLLRGAPVKSSSLIDSSLLTEEAH